MYAAEWIESPVRPPTLVKTGGKISTELGKVTLKINGDEALSDESVNKSNGNKALNGRFFLRINGDEAFNADSNIEAMKR
jgi:hypothetical protein